MNPAAWQRLETFLLARRDLSPTTTRKVLRSLRFMEREGFSVARPTRDAYDRWLARRKQEGRVGPGVKHYTIALRHLLAFRGRYKGWEDLRLPKTVGGRPRLSPDHVVHDLLRYHDDGAGGVLVDEPFADALTGAEWHHEVLSARFGFTAGFYLGVRTPSELHRLQVDDFDQDTHELQIHEAKTGRTRTLQLEPWLGDKFTAWIEGPRDMIAKRRTRQLIPHPATGDAWSREALRMFLWRHGRTVDDAFTCYGMRRWGLVWRCLQWQMNVLRVKDWAGHESITSTMYYLRTAEAEMRRRVHQHEVKPLTIATI